jgi:hypothetical protein
MSHWRRFAGLTFLGVIALGALLLIPSRPVQSKTGNQILIIATASVRGEISPCG